MPWLGAYSASDKCPVLEKGPAILTRLDSLCKYTSESLWVSDTPVHIHVHVHGDHVRIQDYNDDTHCECMTNYGFTHVSFVQKCHSREIFQ